jgi:outer membrane protein OmpA-like peptidoglycan-associated protein
MNKIGISVLALVVLPTASANAQWFTPGPASPGLYIGAEGGLNWLLSNYGNSYDTGYAVGGKIGYDFVGWRAEVEGLYRNNQGRGWVQFNHANSAFVNGQINQVSVMANVLYDFAPGAVITPYVGAGIGMVFADPSLSGGCTMCGPAQFGYQGIVGVAWNIDQSFRLSVDGRYFGSTSGGFDYRNNNITAMLGLTYKFAAPEAAPPPPPPAPQATSFMVFFDWDRSNLSQQALATIQQAANAFKAKGSARITATGHTDTSGPENYNMALSLRRANAVKDALVRDGVPATAIAVIGRGEQGLLVPTPDGVREPQNRRVEIVLQ